MALPEVYFHRRYEADAPILEVGEEADKSRRETYDVSSGFQPQEHVMDCKP